MFYLAGIVITVFLAFILAGKKHKSTADKILLAWLFLISVHLLFYYQYITGLAYQYSWVLGIHFPFPLLHGPFLYLYTAALTNKLPKKVNYGLLHFIPALIFYLPLINFFKLPPQEKIDIYKRSGQGYELYMTTLYIAIVISGIIYVSVCIWLLRIYRVTITSQFSYTEKINLLWLRYLIYGIAVIWILVIFGNDALIFSTLVIFVFLLGFFGIRQHGIFSNNKVVEDQYQAREITIAAFEPLPGKSNEPVKEPTGNQQKAIPQQKLKYEKSGLSEDLAKDIYERLANAMKAHKLYADPELSLSGLASALNVHPNHLSQVINSFERKNFYDYINAQRVEEFKSIAGLPENAGYTLLFLSYECGFNSKTSFNRNFKKVTGLSPTEYLQQHHIELK